jgi:acyl-CoA synthetase (AMP-forming)/AMP-acid ligase II
MTLATVEDRYSRAESTRYYAEGLWQDYTLFGAVEAQASSRPDKVFISDSTTSYTFSELRARATELAAGLRKRGIERGDRIAVQIPNWAEFAVIAVAIARLGAVIVPIMPIYRRDEVGYIVEAAQVKAVFTCSTYRGFDHAGLYRDLQAANPELATIVVLRSPSEVAGTLPYDSLFEHADDGELARIIGDGVGPDDAFAIVFTSGTTSRPKGCLHTFNTMACSARLLGRGFGYTVDDVQFGPSPVTHTTGLVTSVVLPLIHGAASHLMELWEPAQAWERIAKYGCTAAVSATTFLQTLVEVYDPAVHDSSSLRLWTAAGSPIPGSFVENARAALPALKVLSLYGRTESVTTTMCTVDDDPARSITSDGKALPGQEVRIVDDNGDEVPRGEEGDIAYRGSMNLLEYINQPEETREIFTADGFSRSGDLGVMDADGYVRVTGRLKDIVIRGGLNISVRQVEDLLLLHPAVNAVAIVAMPDPRLGEKACCYLVVEQGASAPSLDTIKEYLLAQGLAIQKIPERLELVDALPMTATGKVQKHLLRADVAAKLTNA